MEGTIFVMPLRGSWDNIIGTDEDRTCDRCRTYVPPDLDFWIDGIPLRSTKTGQIALLSYGLCSSCDAEDD